ncbi:MAG: hypothetical protein AB8B85_21215 [Paracoccaceae bacterium]
MIAKSPRSASEHSGRYGQASVDSPVSPCPENQDVEPSSETLLLELETDEGLRIPHAKFTVRFENGEVRSGKLTRNGELTLHGVPVSTPFEITYDDPEDVRAKALAVRLNAALSTRDFQAVVGVLRQSSLDIVEVRQNFEQYFAPNMAEACRTTFSDENGGIVVRFLLAKAGLAADVEVFRYDDGA